MFRSTTSILALLAAMTVPAVAADYSDWGDDSANGPDFRTSYPVEPSDWAGLGDDDDPLSFEFGIRYWYSMGAQEFTSSGGTVSLGYRCTNSRMTRRIRRIRKIQERMRTPPYWLPPGGAPAAPAPP